MEVIGNREGLDVTFDGASALQVAKGIAHKACQGISRLDLEDDLFQHLMVVVLERTDLHDRDGVPHRAAMSILKAEAKKHLSALTTVVTSDFKSPLELAECLAYNPAPYLQEALGDLDEGYRQLLEDVYCKGLSSSEAVGKVYPAKPGADPKKEQARIRKNMQNARDALAKVANRKAVDVVSLDERDKEGQLKYDVVDLRTYERYEYRCLRRAKSIEVTAYLYGVESVDTAIAAKAEKVLVKKFDLDLPLYVWGSGGELSPEVLEGFAFLTEDDITLLRVRYDPSFTTKEKRQHHAQSMEAVNKLRKVLGVKEGKGEA